MLDYSLSNEKPERLRKKNTNPKPEHVKKKSNCYTKFTWVSMMITLRILFSKLCFFKKMHISYHFFPKKVKKVEEGIQRNPISYFYRPNIFFSNVHTDKTFFLNGSFFGEILMRFQLSLLYYSHSMC